MISPGNDGFKTEFYNFFWFDVKQILVKSFKESYSEKQFTISQRQGIITWISKEGKSKYSLKKWRPITLLNVDLKICWAAIANRLKPVLVDWISQTHKGFLKGRYIGECTRLIFDLIEKNGRGWHSWSAGSPRFWKKLLIQWNGLFCIKLYNFFVLGILFVLASKPFIMISAAVL